MVRAEQREYRSRKARKKEKRARKDAGQDEVSAAFKVRAEGCGAGGCPLSAPSLDADLAAAALVGCLW